MGETRAHDKRWWTLAVLVLSLVMVVVANTVLNVALPTLARELASSSSDLQWIVDSYALVFAATLLTAGALGDRFGRKGALQIGMLIFGTSSLLSAFADSPGQLIITRATMGVGAALIMPATLAILTSVFPPRERGKAIGIWVSFAGAGAAVGPIAGGWLLQRFSWGAVFLVNVPLVAIALLAGRRLVPASRDPEHRVLDPVGALLSVLTLTTLLYGIIEGPNLGWGSATIAGAFTLAVCFAGGFFAWELRSDHPMLDLRIMRDPRAAGGSTAITFSFFAMFGVFFLLTQYLQVVLGYPPLEAGIRSLPIAAGLLLVAPRAAALVERFGSKHVVSGGLGLTSVGLLLASRLDADSDYPFLAFVLIVMAIGMALTTAPSTAAIMAAMPMGKAGVGSAVNDTTRELGGALGVAVLGSIASSRYTDALLGWGRSVDHSTLDGATESVGAAIQISNALGPEGVELSALAKQAFTDAMGLAFLVAAAIALLAALLVIRFLPRDVATRDEALRGSRRDRARDPLEAPDGAADTKDDVPTRAPAVVPMIHAHIGRAASRRSGPGTSAGLEG